MVKEIMARQNHFSYPSIIFVPTPQRDDTGGMGEQSTTHINSIPKTTNIILF